MRYKRDAKGEISELKARCSFDGAQRARKREARAERERARWRLGSPTDHERLSPVSRMLLGGHRSALWQRHAPCPSPRGPVGARNV